MAKKPNPTMASEPDKNALLTALSDLEHEYELRNYDCGKALPLGLNEHRIFKESLEKQIAYRRETLLQTDAVLCSLQEQLETVMTTAKDQSTQARKDIGAMMRRVRTRVLTPKLIEEVQAILERWDTKLPS